MSFLRRFLGGNEPKARGPAIGAQGTGSLQARKFGGREDDPYGLEVVGESYRQDVLWKSVAGVTPDYDGKYRCEAVATLVREPRNEYDPNAVAVHLAGGQVGYLSREDAADYADILDDLRRAGVMVSCTARIVGGLKQRGGSRESLGVWLDLDYAENLLNPSPDRPARLTRQRMPVTGESDSPRLEQGFVRGKHYTDYVEDVKALKRHDALAQAETLLLELIDAVERESKATRISPAPWYYEQVAIVRRKNRDFAGEVAIIERYLALDHGSNGPREDLLLRLDKAKEKLTRTA